MADKDKRGVEAVVGGILSGGGAALRPVTLPKTEATPETPAVAPERPDRLAKPPTVSQSSKKPPAAQKVTPEPVKPTASLRGRPPGPQSSDREPKVKAAIYVNAALMARYRERAYADRIRIGELVERALFDYEKRTWGKPSKGEKE